MRFLKNLFSTFMSKNLLLKIKRLIISIVNMHLVFIKLNYEFVDAPLSLNIGCFWVV